MAQLLLALTLTITLGMVIVSANDHPQPAPGRLPNLSQAASITPKKATLLPDSFTQTIETVSVQEGRSQVWTLHVDRTEKIVVHNVELPLSGGDKFECFYLKIVRDFRAGLEFKVSGQGSSASCIVQPISAKEDEGHCGEGTLSTAILDHAKLLLFFDPNILTYWGQRPIRDIQSDIWLQDGPLTSEFAFAANSSTLRSLASFSHHEDLEDPTLIAISHLFPSPPSHAHGHPQVKECLDTNPINLRLVLQAPLDVLSESTGFLESIRKALSGLAGISILRISDLAVSSWGDGWTATYFSLHEVAHFQPGNNSENTHASTLVPVNSAVRVLREITERHEITVRIGKHLVGVMRGSLSVVPRGPQQQTGKRPTYTSYTSGSVAGLGLAMAVLGLGLGILLGFVLWSGSSGRSWRSLPYSLS